MDPHLPPPLPSGPGQVVLGCTIEAVLGKGGMGVVYRARDPAGRPVALKMVLGLEGTRRERFAREAQALAGLRHPGIVNVYTAELTGMTPAIVMELVEGGRGLDAVYADPKASLDHKLDLLEQVCRAVEHAHAQGIVHRDLKPANVLVTQEGRAKVADFGLALDLKDEGSRLTKTGAIVGTPNYLAPEQVNGAKDVTQRCDVWSLGVMLFEALTAARPFEGDSAIALLGQILGAEPPAPSSLRPDLGVDHDAVVARALAKKPAERYPSAGALGDEIARLRAGSKPLAPPPPRARSRGALVALAGLVIGGLVVPAGLVLRSAGRDAGAPAVHAPPTIALQGGAAALATTTATDRLVLEGTLGAAPGTAWVELAAGELRARLAPGPFRLTLPLRPGANRIALAVVDPRGAIAAPVDVLATWDVPAWFVELPVDRRPPLPLPPGLRWADTRERYRAADGSELVWVPAATYHAGHPDEEHEKPHEVKVERGFFIGRTEVSWGQWKRWAATLDVPAEAVATGPRTTDDRPVTGVPWALAARYCEAFGLRLPTEAEWELAARGTDGRRFPWGDAPPGPSRCRGEASHLSDAMNGGEGLPTVPVDSFPDGASPHGCVNMIGNASEWTATPSWLPGERVARGASWLAMNDDSACRRWSIPEVDPGTAVTAELELNRVGIRVAR